jgi:hypothetical protein
MRICVGANRRMSTGIPAVQKRGNPNTAELYALTAGPSLRRAARKRVCRAQVSESEPWHNNLTTTEQALSPQTSTLELFQDKFTMRRTGTKVQRSGGSKKMMGGGHKKTQTILVCVCVRVCVVPGLELRAYTLSHSTSPFCVRYFRDRVLWTYLPRLALVLGPPDLCLLSS